MNRTTGILSAAISGLLIFGLASANATAADAKMEKCYGVAKAGKNDCGGKGAGHSCAGQASKDADKNDFVAVPMGTCSKIANGSTEPVAGMMQK